MNTTKIEKLLKKEIKKIDSDLFDQLENIRVFAQSKDSKKPLYCVIFSMKKEKCPDLNYFARMRGDKVKDLKTIYFDVLGEFVKACGSKKKAEKVESKDDAYNDILKKRWKKIKKAIE